MRKSMVTVTATTSMTSECDAVTSSTSDRDVRRLAKKNRKKLKKQKVDAKPFLCQFCRKTFSKRRILEKHLAFHVEENKPCQFCGKVFDKVLT
jgi:hypothetical protein